MVQSSGFRLRSMLDVKHAPFEGTVVNDEPRTPKELPGRSWEYLEKIRQEISGAQEIASQAFSARQGYFEKLILLNGATLTLLFTVIGGLSHANVSKETLVSVGHLLFIACWLFIVSIMLSLLHNHVNISYLLYMTAHVKRSSLHASHLMLMASLKSADLNNELEVLPETDPEAEKAMKKGAASEKLCRWIGFGAQTLTILGYVALVTSLQTVIQALASGTP